jgi:hypothetical protein
MLTRYFNAVARLIEVRSGLIERAASSSAPATAQSVDDALRKSDEC